MFAKMLPVIGVGTVLAVIGLSSSSAADDQSSQPPSPEAQKATVVATTVKRPPRVVHRTFRISLTTHPTPAEVRQIIAIEAARWGVPASAMLRRSYCESNYKWWAANGQYVGIFQFGPNAFYRGLSTIHTRLVKFTYTKMRRMHSRVYRQWSNGRQTRNRGRVVRQHMIVTKKGWIPRHPSLANPWAQARIAAQAIRGISAVHSSEWSCST